MTISRLLALADHIADTGLVYLVTADGQVKPTRVDDYLAMTARELRGMLVQGTRGRAERAAWKRMGIEVCEIQRN
jgi:hypothetical protein